MSGPEVLIPITFFVSAAEVKQRLAELEERQDFTERLLAQQRDRAALGRGVEGR